MNKPFITHSEITDEIYIIFGKEKYCVTDQVIRAMTKTGRMEQRPHGEWIDITGKNDIVCSVCGHKAQIGCIEYCGCCGADMRKEGEAE